MIRLNKYLAMCGVASRRKVEEILLEGRVRVNGKIVLLPSIQVEGGEVTLDGEFLFPKSYIYIIMNKPAGYVCAVSDAFDPVVLELLSEKYRDMRIFPVGRLDRDTEGLLILTNDGDFANKIMHPSFGITKEYEARLDRPITEKAIKKWKQGYEIGGQLVKPLELEVIPPGDCVRVVIGEGLKREVREMIRLAGFKTEELTRRKIGKMTLQNLKVGEYSEISLEELTNDIICGNGGGVRGH